MDRALKNCYSTGKIKIKQSQPIHVEHSSCTKITSHNEMKEREKSQPVRITELLQSFEGSKSTKKCGTSVRKKRQPERLTAWRNKKSTEKKQKSDETSMASQSTFCEKNVRRNLNTDFETTQTVSGKVNDVSKQIKNEFSCSKSIKETESEVSTSNQILNNSNPHLTNRKSFLLPPNTIKKKYFHDSVWKKNSALSSIGQEHIVNEQKNYTQEFIMKLKHYVYNIEENIVQLKLLLARIEKEESSSMMNKFLDVDKLAFSLTEEINDSITENESLMEINCNELKKYKKMEDKEIQVKMCNENADLYNVQGISNSVEGCTSDALVKCNECLSSINLNNNENKENCETSAQTNDKNTSSNTELKRQFECESSVDDSFLKLERELCISKGEPVVPHMLTTPTPMKKWKKSSTQSLREYMILKSSINLLKTPDTRRILLQKDKTSLNSSITNESDISTRVFTALQDLNLEF